jgi:hypothetical protein
MTDLRHDPNEYWRQVTSFYQELIDRYGWKQGAMLELVERLALSSWAGSIYPSTSHEALGVSLHEFYEERRTAPMVYLQYSGDTDTFEIIYQKGQGHTVSSEVCQRVDDLAWQRIVAWLRSSAEAV